MKKIFPVLAISLLALAGSIWTNLDALKERSGDQIEQFEPPYEVRWIPWEEGLVEAKRKEGNLVWLTFSADWDLLSKLNESRVFENDEFQAKLAEYRVTLILADMTRPKPEMKAERKKYGRDDLPADFVFPADAAKGHIILPEHLSPEVGIEALDQAARQ